MLLDDAISRVNAGLQAAFPVPVEPNTQLFQGAAQPRLRERKTVHVLANDEPVTPDDRAQLHFYHVIGDSSFRNPVYQGRKVLYTQVYQVVLVGYSTDRTAPERAVAGLQGMPGVIMQRLSTVPDQVQKFLGLEKLPNCSDRVLFMLTYELKIDLPPC